MPGSQLRAGRRGRVRRATRWRLSFGVCAAAERSTRSRGGAVARTVDQAQQVGVEPVLVGRVEPVRSVGVDDELGVRQQSAVGSPVMASGALASASPCTTSVGTSTEARSAR
jgi:hypothetical protein